MKSYQLTFSDEKIRTVENIPDEAFVKYESSVFSLYTDNNGVIAMFLGVTQFWETSLVVSAAQKKDWIDENREL